MQQTGVDLFLNMEFRILEAMYDHQIEFNGEIFVPLSQQDIAIFLSRSLYLVQSRMAMLQDEGYITKGVQRVHGRYYITPKGEKLIKLMKNIRSEMEGSSG